MQLLYLGEEVPVTPPAEDDAAVLTGKQISFLLSYLFSYCGGNWNFSGADIH